MSAMGEKRTFSEYHTALAALGTSAHPTDPHRLTRHCSAQYLYTDQAQRDAMFDMREWLVFSTRDNQCAI